MDRKLVINTLKDTLQKMNKLGIKDFANLAQSEDLYKAFEISDPLAQVLAKQDEFAKPKNLHVNFASGSSQYSEKAAAFFLCRHAEQHGKDAAVDSLIEMLCKTEADLLLVMEISGVSCENEIQLEENIKMVPYTQLPSSYLRDSWTNSKIKYQTTFEGFSGFKPPSQIHDNLEKAYLIYTIKVKPVFFDYNEGGEKDHQFSVVYDAYTRLDEVRLCLTAIGICSPLEERRWHQFKDEVLADAIRISTMSFRPIEIKPFRLRKSEKITEENTVSVINSYFKLPEKFQHRMIRALDRLNKAMRRSTLGDIALELSIALEAILLDSERGDNRFKVSMRSGIAFSNDLEQRVLCRNVVKKMYDIRSKLVHDGIDSPIGNKRMKETGLMREATSFSAVIMTNLIKNGPPNWPELELSVKSLDI